MNERVYIFGAHSRARTLGVYLTSLYPGLTIEAYLINNDEKNAKEIEGVPVLRVNTDTVLDLSVPVYLGVRGIYHEELTALLTAMGMKRIIPVTPKLDIELRNHYLEKYLAEQGRDFKKLNEYSAACVYVVKSAADKPLKNDYELKAYEKEIQVGAALTEKRIAAVTDDTGFHISQKNRQFCELTGLYWIWKNAKEDIVGLEHYRRHFLCQADWVEKMERNHIDVILPTPLYVAPSLAQNYRDRHVASDWEFMMDYLKVLYPEDYEKAQLFFETTNLYSPCNMFIMRKRILNDVCSWMFPILLACADHIGEREDAYQNRYPGFLSERLMSFFFEKCRDNYRIVYADKNFLE